jgi:transcriptional regulator with XRE-family HTH domain
MSSEVDLTPQQGRISMSNESHIGLGQRLSVLAKLKGLTQEEIAKTCAISRISVNRFFRQRTEIRASDFKSLLGTLGIDLDAIIDRAIERQIHGPRPTEPTWLLHRKVD